MKKVLSWLRIVAIAICAVGAIACLVLAVIVQLQNPELTQTQLLLANWPLYLGIVVFAGGAELLTYSWDHWL